MASGEPIQCGRQRRRFDATAAANDNVGALGDHAAACSSAGPRRAIVDAMLAVHHALRPRMITFLVGVLLTAIVAALIVA